MDALPSLVPSSLALTPPPPADQGAVIRMHRDAFLAHPGVARRLGRQPGLGRSIPWVLVTCRCIEATIEGIVIGGDWDADLKEWVFDSTFTVFDGEESNGSSFTGVNGWLFSEIEVIGVLAGDAA